MAKVPPAAPERPASRDGDPSWGDSTRPSDLRSPPSSLFGTSTGFGPGVSAFAPNPGAASAFDVCHVGVVLRAVLFVQGVVAVGALYGAAGFDAWLLQFAVASGVTLPGVLAWLVVACLLKGVLGRRVAWFQWGVALGLGAACAAGTHLLQDVGGLPLMGAVSWKASAASGGLLAACFFYWLTLRARARLPADAAARLAELQSRIRPHFLFNTLNTAIALARHDPARTETLLEDLAELFRVALNDSGEAVTLADEVALAQRYLAIEQVRFGDRLKVTWELDEDAGQARVPPLLLQPLVENAVRHGVEPSPDGGQIRVRTRVKRAHAVIVIVNTMPGKPSRPGNGIALRNVRERLRLMHDVTAQFEIRADNQFFRVQMVVPL